MVYVYVAFFILLATSSTASIIGIEKMRNSSFSSAPAFLRIHLILHTAGERKCSLSSLPNRMMVEFVICPFIVSFALFKNVTSSHPFISVSRSGCSSMNFSRALAMARGSRSSIPAFGITCADQSTSTSSCSSNIAFLREAVNSINESSNLCHALLCA